LRPAERDESGDVTVVESLCIASFDAIHLCKTYSHFIWSSRVHTQQLVYSLKTDDRRW
jgi:hypothetical protein